jgi:hypothetical protein
LHASQGMFAYSPPGTKLLGLALLARDPVPPYYYYFRTR